MKTLYNLARLSMFALLCAWLLIANALPAGVTQHASVEGITEYRLPNGMAVLLFPDESKPLVTVNITYKVGSKHENYGETGMAHLLEHLLFKGTPSITNLAQQMAQRGMKWNGTTYFDRTNYFETFSASDDNLTWALKLEADRMVNSFIAQKDLDTEMPVVYDELRRGENNAQRVLNQRMMSAAFDWHNYGKSTIGAVSDLENVSIERLQAFYKLYYQPDNAVLTVAGRFDADKTLAQISAIFGSIPKPSRVLPKLYTVEPTQDGERRVSVRRTGDTRMVSVLYHAPGVAHPDHAPIAMLLNILGTEPAGRLYATLNDKELAADTYAWSNSLADRSVLIVGATLAQKHKLDVVEKALTAAVEQFAKATADELARAQQEYESQFDQLLKSPESLAVALSESIGHGDWRLLFVHREAIKSVKPADVDRVAKAYFKTDNRTVGVFIPTAQPERAAIAVVPNASAVADAVQFAAPRASGERFDPTPAALESRTVRGNIDFNSASKIPYLTLQKQNRGDGVTVYIQLRWGTDASINASRSKEAAGWVAALLTEGSTGLSKQTLADELNRLKTTLSIQSSPAGAVITMRSEKTHLIAGLKLLDTVLKKPLFEAFALEKLRSAALAGIASKKDDPESRANNLIAQRNNIAQGLSRSDWRYALSIEEEEAATQALKIADIKAAYNQFWSAKNAIVSVVGTLPDGLKAAVTGLLSGWSASPAAANLSYARSPNVHVKTASFSQQLQMNDKTNAALTSQAALPLLRTDPDYWPLQLASSILGGDPFNSRIGKRLRVTEGLSYSAGSFLNADLYDNRTFYGTYASFQPKNLAKIQAGLREELATLIANGVTAQELKDAQANMIQSLDQRRTSDAYLAPHLAFQHETGLTFAVHDEHSQRIAGATVESVNAAIRKHFANLQTVEVAAGDWTK